MSPEQIFTLFESHKLLELVAVFFLFNMSLVVLEIVMDFATRRGRTLTHRPNSVML